MSKSATGGLMAVGLLLVVLGIAGFAVPYFTTEHKEDVAKLGSLKLQTTESTPHVIPPALAGGALLIGLVFVGIGVSRRA